MSDPIQTAAVAAALSGERAHETVSFPTTGDSEADLMMGVLAVTKARSYALPRGARSRILRCLADRFEQEEKPVDFNPAMVPGVLGGMGSAPNAYQPWNDPPGYQTTGGLGGLHQQWASAQSPPADVDSSKINSKASAIMAAFRGKK